MPHQPGAYLGGMRTVDDLRARCVLDETDIGSPCWHLHSPRGKALQPARDAAHGLGVAASGVIAIRAGKAWATAVPASSVWTWAAAA